MPGLLHHMILNIQSVGTTLLVLFFRMYQMLQIFTSQKLEDTHILDDYKNLL